MTSGIVAVPTGWTTGQAVFKTLPAVTVIPPLVASWNLRAAMLQAVHPHPDVPLTVPAAWVLEEAQDALDALTPLLAPASPEAIAAFLWPVADAVEYTPEEDIFWRRVKVLHLAAEHAQIPHVAWTKSTSLSLCLSAGRYFPSVEAIVEAVMPSIQALIERRDALKAILALRE
jgi:hypothetical protein